MKYISKPVVLVTGALTGIGRATAFAFAEEGAQVAISGRHPEQGEALVAGLKLKGASDAAFFKADVRNESEVSALVDDVVKRFGRLDVAVNNAGKETLGMITDFTEQAYDEVFGTNVKGSLFSLKHEFRVMKARAPVAITMAFAEILRPSSSMSVVLSANCARRLTQMPAGSFSIDLSVASTKPSRSLRSRFITARPSTAAFDVWIPKVGALRTL
jgi:NAD(P)-dependent dehydrogenase (short-subunit alcohol dehydrogenase family)